jgi:hypothetical protein
MTRFRIAVVAAWLSLVLGCAGARPAGEAGSARFEFALIGDQQYNEASEAQFPRLMADVDRSSVAFVVHVGDFKAGTSMPCTDELFESRKRQFDTSRHPFIFTPGDNDWTDCHNERAGKYEPIERLGKLRAIFFAEGRSLGRRMLALRSQGDDPRYARFRENVRWSHGGVLFATIHMVGDNNNLGRTAAQDAEFRERDAANLAWLRDVFAAAKRDGSRAVALFTQANPRFERSYPTGRVRSLGIRPPPTTASGFAAFLTTLEAEVVAFGKPVALLHGDTHYFRVDKPLFRTGAEGPGDRGRQIENFTRVESFGFPEAHWIRVIVDPTNPGVFVFKEEIVEGNRFQRRPEGSRGAPALSRRGRAETGRCC